jgi:hypothetical protein
LDFRDKENQKKEGREGRHDFEWGPHKILHIPGFLCSVMISGRRIVIVHHRDTVDTEYFLFFDFYSLGASMASGTDGPADGLWLNCYDASFPDDRPFTGRAPAACMHILPGGIRQIFFPWERAHAEARHPVQGDSSGILGRFVCGLAGWIRNRGGPTTACSDDAVG